ncbi:hypothetical protein BDZ97DRAFT_1902747 [Flammula alnicola]|nr:hypothetical protein BDZ97DRAFT_1902747 [Flammula alnicola]
MFPASHEFVIQGGCFNEAQTQHVDYSTKYEFNVTIVAGDKAQPDELGHLLNPEKWEKLIHKANILVAERNGQETCAEEVHDGAEGDEPPTEPERPLEIPQVQKRITIYTGVDKALKKLKRSIDVVFILTPAISDSDTPWPTIVWKVCIIDPPTMQTQIIWSSQAGFCGLEELDDGTLRPGDLKMAVQVCDRLPRWPSFPGCAAILQNVDNEHDFSEQIEMPFTTNDFAVCNMTGSNQRFALCTIDPTKPESDQFSPVVDLDSVGDVFACGPPVMLQAYVVPGYRERQPIDTSKLLRPLFVNAASKPQPIDISRLDKPVTAFRLYSNAAGKLILEKD